MTNIPETGRTPRVQIRLVVIQILVLSLLGTLGGRLWYLQIREGDEYAKEASGNHVQQVVEPAVRGSILGPRSAPAGPQAKIPMHAKTGTAEVYGKQTTSWFATYTKDYTVVMTISQGGTGSGASGPAVRNIYALYGVSDDGTINKKNALLPTPEKSLPKIQTDGTIKAPKVAKDPAKDQRASQEGAPEPDETQQAATVNTSTGGNRLTRRGAVCAETGGCSHDRGQQLPGLRVRPRARGLDPAAGPRLAGPPARLADLFSALALSMIGSLLVFSATRNRTEINQGDPYYFLIRHLMNTSIGFALMIGTVWVGHRTLRTAVPLLYGASVFLILLVLTPLGSTVNGAHSWIVLGGGFSLQPSEFVKITIILGMAMLLAARVDAGDKPYPDHRTVLQALGLAAVPMLIVMLMPDLGSVMVMVIIVLGVLLASGASNRWVFGLLGAGTLGAVAVWQLGILDEYQIARFAAFANPSLDPAGVGYNTNQARIAIGSAD